MNTASSSSGTWNASADAQYFVQWIDALIAHIQSQTAKKRLTPDQEKTLIAMYTQASKVYEQKE